MHLRWYADTPLRRAVQVVVDLLVLGWVVAWAWLGTVVHDAVVSVAQVGFLLRDGSHGVAVNLDSAGGNVARVPLVGDTLATPLTSAGGAAGAVAGAGQALGDRVAGLATPLGVLFAVAPVLSVVLLWGPLRWRFARRAAATAELARVPGGDRLLALRALATRPAHELVAIAADPLDGWRQDDPGIVGALADLELARTGVRRSRIVARPDPPALTA